MSIAKRIFSVIDCIALFVVVAGVAPLVGAAVMTALFNAAVAAIELIFDFVKAERWWVPSVASAAVWLACRWKVLNKPSL